MIISHKYKFIFIHIPKTAGSAITKTLKPFLGNKDVVISRIKKEITSDSIYPNLYKHSTAQEIKNEIPEDIWNTYYKFAFVRNPWDMMVSWYFFRRKYNKRDKSTSTKNLSFNEFVSNPKIFKYRRLTRYIFNNDGETIVDFVGRFESLGKDFKKICEDIGLKKVKLLRSNSSTHSHYSKYYTETTREKVREFFEKDIEIFGYKFKKINNSFSRFRKKIFRKSFNFFSKKIKKRLKKLYFKISTSFVEKEDKETKGIVVEKRKYIYFFIPKVACTSLKKMIAESMGLSFKNIHQAKFCYIKNEEKTLNIYNGYYKFAFVRNPWDRMVSCYNSKLEKHIYKEKLVVMISNFFHKKWGKSSISFEEFVELVCKTSDKTANHHFRAQYSFVTNSQGKLIVDFIGKLENFDEDFKIVSKKIGLEDITIRHDNQTKSKHYSEYYTEKTREMVRERFKEDIERFGYEYEDLKANNELG